MRQQKLVWVQLPFSNMRSRKVRPAVVMSNALYNHHNPDVLVCAVTSKRMYDPYSVLIDTGNLAKGSLPLKSRIRADKLLHIDKKLIVRPFATLNSATFDKVVEKIMLLVKRQK